MKKFLVALIALCLLLPVAAGCSDKGDLPAKSGGIDVDLTAMSSTMVYGEVYNIVSSPDSYVGKTIKMSGPYYSTYFDATGQYYHFVMIEDAAACCQQGLEFKWNGEHVYPNDYPEDSTRIEIIGVFGSYKELGESYPYLAVDEITVISG